MTNFKQFVNRWQKEINKTTQYGILTITVGITVARSWAIQDIFLLTAIIWMIMNNISSKLFAKIAIFFLIITPIFLSLSRDNYAHESASYAYIFLILGVVWSLIEAGRGGTEKVD